MRYLYAGTILRVNLSNGQINKEPVEAYADRFVGSRGINIKLLFDSVEPATRPFDSENVLLFGAGPLVGTPFPGACRTDVMARSPVTGALGDSSMGGYFASELKFAGYDNLVVQGRADRPVYLFIRDDRVEIRDASALWGKDTYETPALIREELGEPGAQVVCIGPAGERKVLYASVLSPTGSSAARTGLGAVMGSKNLKAVAVRGTKGIKVAQPQAFLEECRKVRQAIQQSRLYDDMHRRGLTRIHDREMRELYQLLGDVWEGAETFSEEEFLEKHLFKRVGCFGCPVACFDSYRLPGVGSGTIKCSPYGDLSWDLRNPDLAVLLETYFACQRYGLDARSVANALAWLMQLHEHEVISAKDTDGIPMKFGSREAILSMARKMAYREGIGDLLAEGLEAAARKIGRGAADFLLSAKGLPLDTHIPATKSRALSWAVSPTGEGTQVQTHLDYVSVRRYVQLPDRAAFEQAIERYKDRAEKLVGIREAADPTSTVGKAALVRHDEERGAVCDMTGVCSWMTGFIGLPVDPEMVARALTLGLGTPVEVGTLRQAAARLRHVERAFGVRSGLTRRDDSVTRAFFQRLKPGGKEMPAIGVTEEELERMKEDYYRLMGWDEKTGIPRRETLESLGLSDVAERILPYQARQ